MLAELLKLIIGTYPLRQKLEDEWWLAISGGTQRRNRTGLIAYPGSLGVMPNGGGAYQLSRCHYRDARRRNRRKSMPVQGSDQEWRSSRDT